MMKIFLVGLSGSGKSYWAPRIADMLMGKSIDMDKELEARQGVTIQDIFAQKGEAVFRDMERKLLLEIIDIPEEGNMVIATGGGVPFFFDQMNLMTGNGLVIYLQASAALLSKRLAGATDRPLLTVNGNLETRLESMLESRKDIYQQADVTLDAATVTYDIFASVIEEFTKK